MANRSVTHKCGHVASHNLQGAWAGRDRKAAWLATQVCPACREAAKGGVTVTADDDGANIIITLSGNTYPVRDAIKEAGYQWDGKAWYQVVARDQVASVRTRF